MTSADSFAYEARIQIFDAAGNLLVAHCGKASGTRFR
jgi:hypothetical protein